MAVNLTSRKNATVGNLRGSAGSVLDALHQAINARQSAIDQGFTAGTNIVTDTELQTVYPDLTVQGVSDGIAAFMLIDAALAANGRAGYIALEKLRT